MSEPLAKRAVSDMTASTRADLGTVLRRPGPFCSETGALPMGEFDASTAGGKLKNAKVLVVGAGGLGCELLKDLSMR